MYSDCRRKKQNLLINEGGTFHGGKAGGVAVISTHACMLLEGLPVQQQRRQRGLNGLLKNLPAEDDEDDDAAEK